MSSWFQSGDLDDFVLLLAIFDEPHCMEKYASMPALPNRSIRGRSLPEYREAFTIHVSKTSSLA